MTADKPIDVEAVPTEPQTQAVAVRETGGAVAQAMSIDELHRHLESIREIMRKEMKEGVDYGKIPGTGDKPGLFQPGAQKLLMTFNLTESVKKEVLREYPPFHREYEFTVTVRAANGKEWDGVGTCSTLESKYRYRKADRRCPACGKNAIIQGKAEYGGGWICFKKKNGCGAKFAENDPKITSQPGGTVDNENPADQWNTVRKMAFKRALVAAAINATNTSELWTQDIEDIHGNAEAMPKDKPTTQAPAAKPLPKRWKRNDTTLQWVIAQLRMAPGKEKRAIGTEYFRKVGPPTPLMPNEEIEALPLRFCPVTQEELDALRNCIENFEAGGDAVMAFEPFDPDAPPKSTAEVPETTGIEKNRGEPAASAAPKDPEWWRDIVIPIPPKRVKRDDYLKHPQTIGLLYELRHGNDEEAEAARQRLWGFVEHYEPKPREYKGKIYQPSKADFQFREALDAFWEYWEKNHPGERL